MKVETDTKVESSPIGLVISKRVPPHLWITASAWGSRLVNMVVQILCLRLLLVGMGTDHYAVYALLNSLFAWYQLADLSIGYGLQNYISEYRAEGRNYHGYLRTAGIAGFGLLVLALGLSFLASPWLGPLLLHQFAFLTPATQVRAFWTVGLFFVISSIAGMGMKAWYALQKGQVANLLTLGASLTTLLGTWWAMQSGDLSHRLLWSLVALAAPPAAAACISVGWLMLYEKPRGQADAAVFNALLSRGLTFWISQILVMMLLKIDYIIIARTLTTHDMVVYNILDRTFGSAFALYSAALQTLWPLAAELIVQKRWKQLVGQIRSYLLFGMLFIVVVTLAFMAASSTICHLLSPHEQISVPRLLIGFFGLFYLVLVWTTTYSIVLYSKSDLKPLMACGAVMAVIGPPLQWYLAIHFGLYGILLGLFALYLATMGWFLPLRVHRYYQSQLI